MKKFLKIIKQGIQFPYHLIKDRVFFNKQQFPNANLESESGIITEINGKKVAVYKDKNGNLKKLSPFCTHLGCLVHWDSSENIWVCPCHESKFQPNGKLITGPAKKDLKRI